ncbi:hypothetical protein [Nocardia amamiensis]|uniref:hypothetical protein n=1 Tax=Nocardia amamiensis TaxID=404578 RepID=UPI00082DDA99|nr:hypothetical protein [Nocardia amamiensis]
MDLTVLAIALINLAATAAVKKLVSGEDPGAEEWAGVATGVVSALLTPASRQSDQLDMMPIREYEQHMLAGRRFLQDLPTQWRNEDNRRHIIWAAHGEFVRAGSVAERQGDLLRQVEAEVSVAGCWLWVPSLPQVQSTLRRACDALARSILDGAGAAAVRAYRQVLLLCQTYGEVAGRALPMDPTTTSAWPAVLVVDTERWKWTHCLGIDMRIGDVAYDRSGARRANRTVAVPVEVTSREGPISAVLCPVDPRSTAAPSRWEDAIESVKEWWSGSVRPTLVGPPVFHGQYVAKGDTWAGELRSTLPCSTVAGVDQLAVVVRRVPYARTPKTGLRLNFAAKSNGIAFLVPPPIVRLQAIER